MTTLSNSRVPFKIHKKRDGALGVWQSGTCRFLTLRELVEYRLFSKIPYEFVPYDHGKPSHFNKYSSVLVLFILVVLLVFTLKSI